MARMYQIISADGHMEMPPDGWRRYVPQNFQDYVPKVITLADGGQSWLAENQPIRRAIGGQIFAGQRPLQFLNKSFRNADGTPVPGTGGPVQRLQEQDLDGIDAEVLYPPFHISGLVEGLRDRRAYRAMVQAYNTWLAEEYCSVAPDRLIGCGIIPNSGIDDAIAELKRCKQLGLRGVTMNQFPNGSGKPQPEDDRFWETALALQISISPHVGFGVRDYNALETEESMAMCLSMRIHGGPIICIAQLICSGVFDRFPELRIYFAETNASWMPAGLFMLDDGYDLFSEWYRVKFKMLPSEYIRKHCRFSFIRDPMAMKLREHLPADILMWGSDFPHLVCSFPESQKWLGIIFDGVPEPLKRKILLENPAEHFGLDLSKPITPTPSAEQTRPAVDSLAMGS